MSSRLKCTLSICCLIMAVEALGNSSLHSGKMPISSNALHKEIIFCVSHHLQEIGQSSCPEGERHTLAMEAGKEKCCW